MNFQNKYLIQLSLALLISSCSNVDYCTECDSNKQAKHLVNSLNDSCIQIFIDWEYEKHQDFDVWRKACWDKGPYSKEYHKCYYAILLHKNADSSTLSVGYLENFKKDFPFELQFDTSKYAGLWFSCKKNGELSIYTNVMHQGDLVLVNLRSGLTISDIFKTVNPFEKIESLQRLKNELGLIKTVYRPEVGNYIQFYLNDTSVVTYFPDKLLINQNLKTNWEPVLFKGQKIEKNWYLRTVKSINASP